MLAIRDLEVSYGGNTVLKLPRLDVEERAQVCLVGGSGTGKTTLLHVIAGLITPTRGSVVVDDEALDGMSERARDRFRAKKIGYVFQSFNLLQGLSALENVALAAHIGGGTGERELLEELGLGHRLHARPGTLSIGEQQRVAIARALVNKPRLLLADEPTANLDDEAAAKALRQLKESAADTTMILVTHDSRARAYFDDVRDLKRLQDGDDGSAS